MTSDELKQSIKMRDVLQQYGIQIDRKGFCCCPFHEEKTASMKIYKDSYHCFGCGASGDIFSFVMGMDNCDFKTAFKSLGGTYQTKSDYQHKIYQYRMQKRKETEQNRVARDRILKREIIQDISLHKIFKMLYTVFSDEWCDAVNRLEYDYYLLNELTEKR